MASAASSAPCWPLPGALCRSRPAFPQAVIGRLDIAYSSTESSQWLQEVLEDFHGAAEKDGLFDELIRAGVNAEEARALFKELLELICIADAVSIALEPVKGKLVYHHQVNQYRSPAGFTERLTTIVKKLNPFDLKHGRRASFQVTTYAASGQRITRITLRRTKGSLDFIESGTMVRLVIAADTLRRIPSLLKAPIEGSLISGFSGELDAGAAVDAYVAAGQYLPIALRYRYKDLRGQLIT